MIVETSTRPERRRSARAERKGRLLTQRIPWLFQREEGHYGRYAIRLVGYEMCVDRRGRRYEVGVCEVHLRGKTRNNTSARRRTRR